jgi:hypothetical protein
LLATVGSPGAATTACAGSCDVVVTTAAAQIATSATAPTVEENTPFTTTPLYPTLRQIPPRDFQRVASVAAVTNVVQANVETGRNT